MTDKKITQLAQGVPVGTDLIPYVSSPSSSPVTKSVLVSSLGGIDGWIPVSGSWSYASSTTITVPTGAASIYSVGDKIKITQTTAKYFYIVAVADTLLTVTAGSVYTVANAAITSPYYSKSATPLNFPTVFTLGTPTWTTTGTAFTNQPPANSYNFSMIGKTIMLSGGSTMHATSGGTGAFTATFPAGQLPVSSAASAGSVMNLSNGTAGLLYLASGGNAPLMAKYDNSTLATNSQAILFSVFWNL